MKKKTKPQTKTLSAHSKRQRKAVLYHLSEKDHPTIVECLKRFIPVYMIAMKIGCGYRTLRDYIHKHRELLEVQQDANENMVEFSLGKLMQNVAAGKEHSIMFALERLDPKRFGQHQIVENVGDLPQIKIGLFDRESEVEPVDPATAGEDARQILDYAIKTANERNEEEDHE